MKSNNPIHSNDTPQENKNQQHQAEESNNEIDAEYDDYYDKKDRDNEEMQEFFLNNRGCKVYDIIIFISVASILAFVWVYIYQLPIPEILKILFGLDDTQYPKDHE